MKQCIHCGKDLPDGASFCPYCETIQGSKIREVLPRPRRHKALPFLTCLAILAAILFVRHFNGPKVIDAKGPQLIYGDYRLILAFSGPRDREGIPEPQEHDGSSLTAIENAAVPSLLFVEGVSDRENHKDDFMELLESVSVETIPRDNAKQMKCGDPSENPVIRDALLSSNIGYDPACGSNDICWTLQMKNGDVLKLQHSYTCLGIESAIYYPEDAPMDTIEDLQALLDRIDAEVPPEMPVSLFLPAVTYEGDLTIDERTCALIGANDGDKTTTFTGTIHVSATIPERQQFEMIRFSGEGPGIEARARVMLFDCTFTDMKTGLAVYGAYIDPHRCLFENCETGLLYDCQESNYSVILELDQCEFRNNRTALHIKAFARGRGIVCSGCSFSSNEADIVNDTDVPLDTGASLFE